jgi:hypothetical protein
MNKYRRFTKSVLEAFELVGRAKVLVELNRMSPGFLRECGFSPELLRQGLSAWPWRLSEDELASEIRDTGAEAPGHPGFKLAIRSIGRSTEMNVDRKNGIDTDPKAA